MAPPKVDPIAEPEKPSIPAQQPPSVAKPNAPQPAQAPQAAPPFTTCTTDATEIAKLPRSTTDLSEIGARRRLRDLTANASKWFADAPAPTRGNTVMPYVYGRCAFQDIADALMTAVNAEHRIYLAGWWGEPWTKLNNPIDGSSPPRPLLQDYLQSSRAQIRALYWDTPRKHIPGDSKALVDFINYLPNGAALEDARLPPGSPPTSGPAAHHQKLLVISGGLGLIAFLGGMDLINDRVATTGFSPLHDVHLRITGPAAVKCLEVFSQRWLDHPDTPKLDQAKFQMGPAAVQQDFSKSAANASQYLDSVTIPGKVRATNLWVSIGRTYAKLSKFDPGHDYQFAPNGEQTAWQLIKNGIQNAKRFIYVEDQYMVSRRAKAELIKKLQEPDFTYLLILMGKSAFFENDPDLKKDEFPYLIGARNELRTDLAKVDPQQKKWRMFSLAPTSDASRRAWCGDFVHSKTWIFDDDFAVVGSANCDDRGYTFDSEVVAGLTEEPLERAAGGWFARNLRIALWRKHLGVPHSQVRDFTKGLNLWLKPPTTAMIYDVSQTENSPLLGSTLVRDDKTVDYVWTHIIDPDADKI